MKFSLLCIILLIGIKGVGQESIANQSLNPGAPDIFYVGVDNRIKLVLKKPDPHYYVAVKGAGSRVAPVDIDEYVVRVSDTGICTLILYRDDEKILEKKYKTETIGHSRAALGGITDSIISKNRVLLNPVIYGITPGCHFKYYGIRILNFQAIFISNGDSILTRSESKQLSSEQIQLVKQLNPGDKIYFEQIRVSGPTSHFYSLPAFVVTIK